MRIPTYRLWRASFVEPPLDPQSLQIASESRRFLNFVLDNTLVRLLGFAFQPMFVAVAKMVKMNGWPGLLYYLAFYFLVLSVYYVPQEVFWGRTLGKFVTGTKVISADGTSPTPLQIVGRTFCRMIPFDWFSYLESCPVGWHDRFSSTRVVMARSAPTANFHKLYPSSASCKSKS